MGKQLNDYDRGFKAGYFKGGNTVIAVLITLTLTHLSSLDKYTQGARVLFLTLACVIFIATIVYVIHFLKR